jgi:hypothetical protein
VIWNVVFGSALKFAMRVSGSWHGEGGSVGSAVQFVRPVAPVVSRNRSLGTMTGESVCSCGSENVNASNGGAAGAGSFRNCASVTGFGGAKPASGVGRNGEYAVLPGAVSLSVLMKYERGLMLASLNCVARPWLGPGVPSALTIPFDSRFDTCCPCFGAYVA